MTSNTTNLGASSPLPEGGKSLRIPIERTSSSVLRTGSVFGAQARFPRESTEIKGLSKQYMRVGDEGSKATFDFCPVCGATVHYSTEAQEESVVIPVGAFAEPSFPSPTFSVYEERKHAWVGLPENIEHMA